MERITLYHRVLNDKFDYNENDENSKLKVLNNIKFDYIVKKILEVNPEFNMYSNFNNLLKEAILKVLKQNYTRDNTCIDSLTISLSNGVIEVYNDARSLNKLFTSNGSQRTSQAFIYIDNDKLCYERIKYDTSTKMSNEQILYERNLPLDNPKHKDIYSAHQRNHLQYVHTIKEYDQNGIENRELTEFSFDDISYADLIFQHGIGKSITNQEGKMTIDNYQRKGKDVCYLVYKERNSNGVNYGLNSKLYRNYGDTIQEDYSYYMVDPCDITSLKIPTLGNCWSDVFNNFLTKEEFENKSEIEIISVLQNGIENQDINTLKFLKSYPRYLEKLNENKNSKAI